MKEHWSGRRLLDLAAAIVFLLAGFVGGTVEAESSAAYLKRSRQEAEELLEAGKLEEAETAYRRISFAQPRYKRARQQLTKVRARMIAPLLEESKKKWTSDPDYGLQLLHEAYEIDPRSDDVKAAFKKRGYKWYEGRYRSKEEIDKFKEAARKRGEERRKELQLPEDRFAIIVRPPFRFFTDVDTTQARAVLEQMMNSVQSHYYKYLEVMEPFGLRYPEEGLDVVLFNDAEDYFKITGAPRGSAGVYMGDRAAGHFFRYRGTYNFPTMLHEMTHQLNHKVLGTIGLSGWYEEGISEYFGAGFLTQQGRRIEVGRPDTSRLSSFNAAVRKIDDARLIPLEDFLKMPRAELTGQYYSQAWALTHYLLEGPAPGRYILFDFIDSAKRERFGRGSSIGFVDALKTYGLDLGTFEKAFLDYYLKGPK